MREGVRREARGKGEWGTRHWGRPGPSGGGQTGPWPSGGENQLRQKGGKGARVAEREFGSGTIRPAVTVSLAGR